MNNKPTDSGDKLIKEIEEILDWFALNISTYGKNGKGHDETTQSITNLLDNYLVEALDSVVPTRYQVRAVNHARHDNLDYYDGFQEGRDRTLMIVLARIKQLKSHTKDKLEPIDGSYKHIPNAEKIWQDDLKNQLEDK